MRIGELSSKTGASRDALRLYERRGLITSARRDNGYRDYDETAVQLVRMIKLAQSIGFTLGEMEPELEAIATHGLGSEKVAKLLSAKLAQVDTRISDLTSRRDELADMLMNVCPIMAKS